MSTVNQKGAVFAYLLLVVHSEGGPERADVLLVPLGIAVVEHRTNRNEHVCKCEERGRSATELRWESWELVVE